MTIVRVILFIVLLPCLAAAGEVTLSWDTDEPVDSFKLFHRRPERSYQYTAPVWTGTAKQATVKELPTGAHFFVVRAVRGDLESKDSNEVMAIIIGKIQLEK